MLGALSQTAIKDEGNKIFGPHKVFSGKEKRNSIDQLGERIY